MISLTGMIERMAKLRTLSLGLAKEVDQVDAIFGALSPAEREGYRECLTDAIAGLDAARVALTNACTRIGRETL